ncbi:MAG TPA: amino acid permease [Bryobacteraceae bacterium]|nr:amino acid permease [Bryobacteraceae bacterium]
MLPQKDVSKAGPETGSGTGLKRDLGAWAAASIVVGTVIGSGIFLVPSTMMQRVGSAQMVFVVWIAGGLLSLAGALSYAELAAAMPEAGGEYVYLREAYGPIWGFLYSWTQMWVAKSGSIAALATGFFLYFADFFHQFDRVAYVVPLPLGPRGGPVEILYGQIGAIVLILALAWLNYFGVRFGGQVQTAVTAIKVILIAALIVIGLVAQALPPANPATSPQLPGLTLAGFVAALVAALWAYDGWNNAAMVGSEIRQPRRNLPRALIGGTIAVIVIYLLANAAYFHVLGAARVAGEQRVAAAMMSRIFGAGGGHAVSVAAMISMFAALNGSILSGARVPYAAARGGHFFSALKRVDPRRHTPANAIVALSLWSCLLVLSGRYDDIFNLVIFASWILYAMTAAAVIVLRKKRPDLSRPYFTVGYPAVPVLFIGGAIILLASTLFDRPRESILGIGIMILGLPFYLYWKRKAEKEYL